MKLSDIEIGAGVEITKIKVSGLDNELSVTLTLKPLFAETYRLLEPKERVQNGDQYYHVKDGWTPAGCIGALVGAVKYRRRV